MNFLKGTVMTIQTTSKNIQKDDGSSRLASLPVNLQSKIRHYLELGDFRAAKALFDAGLKQKRERH